MNIVTEASTDYGEVTTNLTFSSCENKTCINVTIVNNDFAEETEFFSISLQRVTNLDSVSLTLDSATVEVEDDDGRLCTFLHSVLSHVEMETCIKKSCCCFLVLQTLTHLVSQLVSQLVKCLQPQ